MCRGEKQEEATKGKGEKEKPEEKEQTSYGWSANREHYLRVLRATSWTSPRASTETMAVTPLRCGVTVTPPDAFFCYGTFCERKQTEPALNFRKWLRTEHAAYLEHNNGRWYAELEDFGDHKYDGMGHEGLGPKKPPT